MSELQVSPISHWRKPYEEGVVVKLPSGAVVRLRPCYVSTLVRAGFVPDVLLAMIADEMGETRATASNQSETIIASADFSLRVCKAMFVYPRIVDANPGDDEITMDMLDDLDINYVTNLFNRPVEALRSFRHEPEDDVAGVDAATGDEAGSE